MASALLMLQIVSFLDLMSIGLIMPQLANHSRQLGFNFVHIGMMGALYSACQTISAPLIGSLTDLKGTKPIFLFCLSICSLSYYFLGTTSSLVVFVMIRGILGTFKQIQLLIKAAITEYGSTTKEQGVLYGKLIAIAGFGMSVGPIISGHVIEAYPKNGFPILTSVVATMFALNTAIISIVSFKSQDKKEKEKPKENAITPTILQSMRNTLKESVNEFYKVDWTIFWDLFLFKILMSLTMGLYFSNFALFLMNEHGITPKSVGYIVAFQGITGSLCNFLISYINKLYEDDTDYTKRCLHLFVTMVFTLTGLALVPKLYLYIALLVPKAICGSVGRVITLEMITSRSNPGQRGAIMGVANSVKSMTGVITPIISGLIAQYLGIKYAYYAAALINMVGVVVAYRQRSIALQKKIK
ncbi:major facilitator superfamily domain-containing protein 9-like [Anticarsia gemmatalis]|uniref:major facilitator superfamily domain-containing protein 9-like n=1 Tax=Anticarsia gemmatalis TaxID=129554 RepID=UPI003F767011